MCKQTVDGNRPKTAGVGKEIDYDKVTSQCESSSSGWAAQGLCSRNCSPAKAIPYGAATATSNEPSVFSAADPKSKYSKPMHAICGRLSAPDADAICSSMRRPRYIMRLFCARPCAYARITST